MNENELLEKLGQLTPENQIKYLSFLETLSENQDTKQPVSADLA